MGGGDGGGEGTLGCTLTKCRRRTRFTIRRNVKGWKTLQSVLLLWLSIGCHLNHSNRFPSLLPEPFPWITSDRHTLHHQQKSNCRQTFRAHRYSNLTFSSPQAAHHSGHPKPPHLITTQGPPNKYPPPLNASIFRMPISFAFCKCSSVCCRVYMVQVRCNMVSARQ